MADVKISQLPAKGSNIAATDRIMIAEDSGGGAFASKYVTGAQLGGGGGGGTVTSVGITTGTTGTNVSVTGSPITTSGTITINIPTASAVNTGKLSNTDYTRFDAKQDLLVSGSTIKTVNSTSLLGSGNITTPVGIHAPRIPAVGGFITPLLLIQGTLATTAQSAGVIRCFPFFPMKTFSIASISINVTTSVASSNARILFFSDLEGAPSSKLYESANIDTSTTGVKTVTQSYTFDGGTNYWLCLHTSASITISTYPATTGFAWQQLSVGNISTNNVNYNYAIGSVPATLTTTGANYQAIQIPQITFTL